MSAKLPVEQFEMASNVRGVCSPDTQKNLLEAWRKKDLEGFKEILRRDDCDPNYLYDNNGYMRLLDKAASDGLLSYAAALIDAGATVNQVNAVKSKAPIHFAVEAAQQEVLELLVSKGADVNILDSTGSTPLHYLARQRWAKGEVMYQRCLEYLLTRSDLKLNVANRKGFTAIHTAVHEGALEALKILLNKGSELDLDSFRVGLKNTTAREEIMVKYPQLEGDLPVPLAVHEIKMDDSMLFSLLHNHHEDRFVDQFDKEITKDKAQQTLLTTTDGRLTFLQTACEKGFKKAVEVLLKHGANVNLATEKYSTCPVGIACRSGNVDILRLLLERRPKLEADTFGETVLHELVKLTGDSKPHQDCLKYLLRYHRVEGLDVNCQDKKGNTPLHYAVKYSDESCVLLLLKHGAYVGALNMFKEPPLANISTATLKKYLDSTIDTNEALPREENYAWSLDYRFLVPNSRREQRVHLEEVKVPLADDTEGDRKPPERSAMQTSSLPESAPLLYMSKSPDLRHLLTHPSLRSFIFLKWQRIQKFYYINALFYSLFCALLTIYILFGYRRVLNSGVLQSEAVDSDVRSKVAHDKFTSEVLVAAGNRSAEELAGSVEGSLVVDVVRGVLIIFLLLIVLREVFQLWISGYRYFTSAENWLEMLLIIVSAFVVFKDCSREFQHSVRLSVWCPQFCAIAILVSWFELVLLVGKHPQLSLNIEMFKTVSMTFLQFLAWYAILIVAFALSFYTLFRGCTEDCSNSNPFTNPGLSVFKTIVMLTGEFEAGDIPFISFIGTSHIIFVAFVFLIAIVLFNLLNGLAVTDTQAIRNDAYLYSTISQVKVISHIENLFLGEDSPLKLRLHRLRTLLCCSSGDNPENLSFYKYFSGRISFFPTLIPEAILYVYPNQNYKIEFGDREKAVEGRGTENCYARRGYFMEKFSARQVEEILGERPQNGEEKPKEEVDVLKTELMACKEKLTDVEKKLETLESANKQSEQLLIQILAILSLNNANNER